MKYLIRPKPHKNESIIWFLLRVARENGYADIRHLYRWNTENNKLPLITKSSLAYRFDRTLDNLLEFGLGLSEEQRRTMFLHESIKPKKDESLRRFCPECYKEKKTMHKYIHIDRCKVCPDHKIYFEIIKDDNYYFPDEIEKHASSTSSPKEASVSDFIISKYTKLSFLGLKSKCFGILNEIDLHHLVYRLEKLLLKLSFSLRAHMSIYLFDKTQQLSFETDNFPFEIIRRPILKTREIADCLINNGVEYNKAVNTIYFNIACQLDFNISNILTLNPDGKFWMYMPYESEEEALFFFSLKYGLIDIFMTEIFTKKDFSKFHSELLGFELTKDREKAKINYMLAYSDNEYKSILSSKDFLYIKNKYGDENIFSSRAVIDGEVMH